jgi:hypothetical protein
MPESTSSPCDSIAREVNELIEKKKEVREALSKAPPSKKPSLTKRMEKVTSELEHKRQQLRKCLKQNPPTSTSDLYIVKEVHQRPVTDDPFVNGKVRHDWTVRMPANMPPPPVSPDEEDEEDFDFLSKTQFAPAVEAQLKPGATREVKLQVEAPSILMGTVRWIGTRSPLDVSLLLNGESLASGTSHGYLKNRGASSLQARTTGGGLATLSVTNTSGITVKVKIVLGALDLIHESEVKQ